MGITIGTKSISGSGNSNKAGGGCMILFGAVFAGFGLLFIVLASGQLLSEAKTYQWTKTPCTVESCNIQVEKSRDEAPFQLLVQYQYEFEGNSYSSNQYTLQEHWSDDYEKLALKRKAMLSGEKLFCYVDSENPASAVMKREGVITGLIMLLPLVFVLIGGAIAWGGIVTLRKKKRLEAGGTESISGGAAESKKLGWVFLFLFGSVFALVGAGVGIPLGIMPLKKMVDSSNWVETPCKIIWSRVQRHESTSDGKTSITWSVDIFYEYEFEGEQHRSNKYEVFGGSSSGRSGKVNITKKYPPGSEQLCYVNPKIPEQALLHRGFTWMALLGLIPVVFFVVGAGIMWAGLRARAKAQPAVRDRAGGRFADAYRTASDAGSSGHSQLRSGGTLFSDKHSASTVSGESRELKPGAKRVGSAFGCLFFALFWNGIVSVFLWQVIKKFQGGNPDWFLTLFLVPFVLVGIAAILMFFYQLLALANPKPKITITPGVLRPGQTSELSWKIGSGSTRIKQFTIQLWGVETATYRRGTNTHTDHEVFYAQKLIDTSLYTEMRSGMTGIELPEDVMPSLNTGNNSIKWELRVNGDIPMWPDVQDTYEIEVGV